MNHTDKTMAIYVSASAQFRSGLLRFVGSGGIPLQIGNARVPVGESEPAEGADAHRPPAPPETETVDCITFVVTLEERTAAVLAAVPHLAPWADGAAQLSTFVFEMKPHPAPAPGPPLRCFAQFPLPGEGPYLCTQGCGGMLTHYFSESYHAIDLRCDVGTPLLAMADGVVTEIDECSTASGIHCQNLCRWNSISLRCADGVVLDYVHIKPHSAVVRVGERVVAGQQLCLTGDVGFSPEPHVHIEAHMATDLRGPSVPIHFVGRRGGAGPDAAPPTPYIPVAGRWYGPAGPASPDAH